MKTLVISAIVLLTSSITWRTNLKEGLIEAKEQHKQILLVFSGSDWCKPCVQLKQNVFQSKQFEETYSKDYVLVNIDLKRDMSQLSKSEVKYREQIAAKYNKKGFFPYVVILDAQGEVQKEIKGYKGETADYYLKQLK